MAQAIFAKAILARAVFDSRQASCHEIIVGVVRQTSLPKFAFNVMAYVHMLWLGDELPIWVVACVKSYLDTGHAVRWWLYMEEREHDLISKASHLLAHPGLRVCYASCVLPHNAARDMYYHGVGRDGRWRGWAPFSDWFRYEILWRYGGWWVDADGVSVRSLADVVGPGDDFIVCTERHRRDRRKVGAVAIADPHKGTASLCERDGPVTSEASATPLAIAGPTNCDFHSWANRVDAAGLDLCLVTNNHFFVRHKEHPIMRALAQYMQSILHAYACDVEARGVDAVRIRSPSIPNSLVGMVAFQKQIRGLLECSATRGEVRMLHWSIFNPVDANDALRMRRVLAGEEELRGKRILTIHIFGTNREELQRFGSGLPDVFSIRVSDELPLPRVNSAKQKTKGRPPEPRVKPASRTTKRRPPEPRVKPP